MGAESHQDLRRRFGDALALLAVAVLAACGAGSGPQPAGDPGARGGTDTQTTSGASEVFFPQAREGLDGGPAAGMAGKLVLDGEGCLRVESSRQGGTWIPVWPANLRLEMRGSKVCVADGGGRTVAEVGKKVCMGGENSGSPNRCGPGHGTRTSVPLPRALLDSHDPVDNLPPRPGNLEVTRVHTVTRLQEPPAFPA